MTHGDAVTPGLNDRALLARLNGNAAAASFCRYLADSVSDLDGTASGLQSEISAYSANIDRAATGLGADSSANIVQLHAAAAALRFHPAGDSRGFNIAAFGFELQQRHIARNHYRNLAREMSRMASALPVANNPSRVAFHVGGDFVLIELAARILLGRIAETRMNHIIDALLLPAAHYHGTHV